MLRAKLETLDAERLSKLASSVQAIVISIGIAVGGAYALYTFIALHSVERAREELAKLSNSLLDLRIEANEDSVPGSGQELYIRATVFAENKGNRPIRLKLNGTPPVWIAKVTSFSISDDPNLSLDKPVKSYIRKGAESDDIIAEQIIRPTEVYRYPAIFRVRDKGVFLVVFEAAVQDEDGHELHTQKWFASTYVTVR